MRARPLLRLIPVLLLCAPACAGAEEIVASGKTLSLTHNNWNWTLVDESGAPVPDVMVLDSAFSGSFSYFENTVLAVATALKLPADKAPLCQAMEDWIRANPEPLELPQVRNMYEPFPPVELRLLGWTDARGQRPERRFISDAPMGRYRLFFKPGYEPVVLRYDYAPPLSSAPDVQIRVQLRSWPERMQTLTHRPWVEGNWKLQKKIEERRLAMSSRKEPLEAWEKQLIALRNQALEQKANRDAAWLTLAAGFAARRTAGRLDTGGAEDLRTGRIYLALDEAVRLHPESAVLSGRKAMRDFALRFPEGLTTEDGLFGAAVFGPLDNDASWSRARLDDYLRTIAAYEREPLLALAISSDFAGKGLVNRSETSLTQAFFRHRAALRKNLLKAYPTASWFSEGLDRWDMFYEDAMHAPYVLMPAASK